jgi:hypothetical protein
MEDPSIGRVIENINKYTNQKDVSCSVDVCSRLRDASEKSA